MTSPVKNPWSNTPGNTPASLLDGQIGVNQADGKLFYRTSAGAVAALSTSGSVPDPYDLGTYPLVTISAQPSSATVTVGQSATFSVTAAATLPSATISYQWQQSTDSGSTWSSVSGATSSSLSYSNLQQSSSGYRYRCRLTANLSQVYTATATLTVNLAFSATAVLLTSGTSYTVPSGAASVKAWAVGAGSSVSQSAAGGCAYKTWTVSGGDSISYAVGAANAGANGSPSTVTIAGTTITGGGGTSGAGGTYSGGDGGANGGRGGAGGGAVGGNGTVTSCTRTPATDVSGLLAAVALAGGKASEDCGASAAFGSGGGDKYNSTKGPGYGGGCGRNSTLRIGGAVVLYFT